MFSDNDHYGHSDVLRRYCGVSGRPRILARIQHGWSFDEGFWEDAFKEPWPKLLWSRRNLESCRRAGHRRIRAIGSPFLYLPPPASPVEPSGARHLLVYPFHGWRKQAVAGDFEAYAEELSRLERDGFGPITVCLHWAEYREARAREPFERRGWSLVTHGAMENNPQFLDHQRDLILKNAYVTSNRVGTAAFYALASGRPFFLLGPPMGLWGDPDWRGGDFYARQRREFPMLSYEAFGDRVHRELGERELGLEYKLDPESLSEALGWGDGALRLRAWRRLQKTAWKARTSISKFLRR